MALGWSIRFLSSSDVKGTVRIACCSLMCLQSERKTYDLQFPARKLSSKVCLKLPEGIIERSCLISQSHSIIALERTSKGQPVHPLPKARPTLSMLFLSNLFLKTSSAKYSYCPQTAHSHAPWSAYKMSGNLFSWFTLYWLSVKHFGLLFWKSLSRFSEMAACQNHKADP